MILATFFALQQLSSVVPAQHFQPVERAGADPFLATDVQRLCPAAAHDDQSTLLRLELAQSTDVDRPGTSTAWDQLGCTRLFLDLRGALSRSGVKMVAGQPWSVGAMNAFTSSLAIKPDDSTAASALALLAMEMPDPPHLADVARLLTSAIGAGVNRPEVLRACGALNLRVHLPDAATRCATRALRLGFDSTEHLLTLARLAFRRADTVGGNQLFVNAAGAAHDSLARDDLTWQLQWFLDPEERHGWDVVSDQDRAAWVRDRLVSRDVRDGQPPGARLAEHFKRLEYADSAFRMRVPKVAENYFRAHGASRDSVAYGAATLIEPERAYGRWQTDFDDRGVIWMRFGPPLQRATHDDGVHADRDVYVPEVEAWSYDLDGKSFTVTFQYEEGAGTSAPSKLVLGYVGEVDCMGVDQRRCVLAQLRLDRPRYQMLVEEDQQIVAAATTNDDNSPRGEKNIAVVARLHRLWDPETGAPMSMVSYALPVKDLAVQSDDRRRTSVVDLELRQWDPAAGAWRDTMLVRRFVLPDSNIERPDLTGFMVTPGSAATSSWSLVASQLDNRRGRAWDVTTPGLGHGSVELSDLVVGSATQSLTWNLHNVAIPLAPVNAVDRHATVELYYQIRSASARSGLRTTVALFHSRGEARDTVPALEVSYALSTNSGVNEVAPNLDVSRLDHGPYRIEVRITDAAGQVLTRRSAALNLD